MPWIPVFDSDGNQLYDSDGNKIVVFYDGPSVDRIVDIDREDRVADVPPED